MTQQISILAAALIAAGVVSPAFAADSTPDFLHTAAVANRFEIDSSKIALAKSPSDAVKEFAKQMVDDHMATAEKMKSAITAAGLDPKMVPEDLDDSHQKLLDKLKMADTKDFDKEYIDAQADAHKDAVDLFDNYAKDGSNVSIKEFAANTLPTLKAHKDHVDSLKKAQ